MEVFSLIKTDVPTRRSVVPYALFSKLATRANKFGGLFKITLAAILTCLAFFSWNTWKSNLYTDYELNNQTVVNKLKSRSSKDLVLATNYFMKGEKIKATEMVSQYYKLNPNDVELGLVYAQLLTSDGYFHVSRYVLNSILLKANSQQKDETMFLMAITFLKEENYSYCKEWLRKIPKKSICYKQAQQLMFKIKPFTAG